MVLLKIKAHVPGSGRQGMKALSISAKQSTGLKLDRPTPQAPYTEPSPYLDFYNLMLPAQYLRAEFTDLLIHQPSVEPISHCVTNKVT